VTELTLIADTKLQLLGFVSLIVRYKR